MLAFYNSSLVSQMKIPGHDVMHTLLLLDFSTPSIVSLHKPEANPKIDRNVIFPKMGNLPLAKDCLTSASTNLFFCKGVQILEATSQKLSETFYFSKSAYDCLAANQVMRFPRFRIQAEGLSCKSLYQALF